MHSETLDEIYNELLDCNTYVQAAKKYTEILNILNHTFNERIEIIQKSIKKK